MKVALPLSTCFQAGPASVVVMATCINSEGRANIITLGMYMPISFDPPLVCIGVSPKRYSHDLILQSGEFVVNVPSIDLEKEMHYCGVESGKDVDKFAETGLTPLQGTKVKPPLIEECFGHLECQVVQSYVCGDHTLFIGEVLAASINQEVIADGNQDLLEARPIVQKNESYLTVTDNK
jgi:flavin reductase (DIM6/NTAB) family NADH-FMN oxidoreductase RutF